MSTREEIPVPEDWTGDPPPATDSVWHDVDSDTYVRVRKIVVTPLGRDGKPRIGLKVVQVSGAWCEADWTVKLNGQGAPIVEDRPSPLTIQSDGASDPDAAVSAAINGCIDRMLRKIAIETWAAGQGGG